MAAETYRAALVGLGNIAWRFDRQVNCGYSLTHASAYERNPGTVLAGGCSPDKDDRAGFEKTFGMPAVDTLESLFETVEPEIVSICSPSALHFEQVAYCLDRQVPMIWLEKPPASSVPEIDRLIEKMTERGGASTILVNYHRRYDPNFRKMGELYREETLGACRLIQITYSRGLELNGSHILDMLFFLVGESAGYEIEWVSSAGGAENPSFGLALESGVQVVVSGVTLPYHCVDISLTCEGGRVSILHGGMTPLVEERIEHELFPGFYRLKKSEQDCFIASCQANGMEGVLDDLIRSHERGVPPASSLQSARKTQELIDSIRTQQGRQVS